MWRLAADCRKLERRQQAWACRAERKVPLTFCLVLAILRSRSPRLLVNGTSAWLANLSPCLTSVTATDVKHGLGATWDEIDTEGRMWTIPASRMKAGAEHRIPLTGGSASILEAVRPLSDGGRVFPTSTSSLKTLRTAAGIAGTVHGSRSSFRDWCAEHGKDRELAEAALAHAVKGVEGGYFRSGLFERRRGLMDAWSRYVTGQSGKIVQLQTG